MAKKKAKDFAAKKARDFAGSSFNILTPDLDEVMNDPQMHARGALRHVAHPTLGDVILPTGAMRFSDEPLEIIPSKALGADNSAIYCDWLGMDRQEFAALTAEGAI